ncbi:glycosyltransferase [Patescibacteria group bacterium]|nr:glycosyltransferase [Patescibacteria group bacterium]
MKYALVHDDLFQRGGAENVVFSFIDILKNPSLFTSIVDKKKFADIDNLYTSFMQKIPFKNELYKKMFFLYPLAFESFNFDNFDIVVSSSTRFAHGIITPPSTMHICYMHSPSRYIWDMDYIKMQKLSKVQKLVIPFIVSYLRLWDSVASSRVDFFIANSSYTKDRIQKFYKRDSTVIHPPVNTAHFEKVKSIGNDNFLYVGRLAEWKRLDIVIKAFNQLKKPLHIVGTGDKKYVKKLRSIANKNIEFLSFLTDDKLLGEYAGCRALIFPSKEDFGIAPIEALACGKPVVAFGVGGVLDYMVDGSTGILFKKQTVSSLKESIERFDAMRFDGDKLRSIASKFSADKFRENIENFIEISYEKYKKNSYSH